MLFRNLTPRRRERHGLASALIGEIVAALEAVEVHSTLRRRNGDNLTASAADFGDLELPRLMVYEANVSRLSLFNTPLPRELSYFYTRLADLPQRLRALKPSASFSAADIDARAQRALGEIDLTMTLGQDLLRSMKQFVSRRQPASISRS